MPAVKFSSIFFNYVSYDYSVYLFVFWPNDGMWALNARVPELRSHCRRIFLLFIFVFHFLSPNALKKAVAAIEAL